MLFAHNNKLGKFLKYWRMGQISNQLNQNLWRWYPGTGGFLRLPDDVIEQPEGSGMEKHDYFSPLLFIIPQSPAPYWLIFESQPNSVLSENTGWEPRRATSPLPKKEPFEFAMTFQAQPGSISYDAALLSSLLMIWPAPCPSWTGLLSYPCAKKS